jgi:hypothetical protein
MDDRIRLNLTEAERRLIREHCQLADELRKRFASGAAGSQTINLTLAEMESLREGVADQLQRVGFDEQWNVTVEGRALEGIIDKLQPPTL